MALFAVKIRYSGSSWMSQDVVVVVETETPASAGDKALEQFVQDRGVQPNYASVQMVWQLRTDAD